MRLTLKEVKATLATIGISIHKIDGEYKVYPKGTIGLAYFTTDLADALATGRAIALNLTPAPAETFAERINPRRFNFSPKFVALVGAIIGHDYGVRDRRGNHISSISITSDGYIIGSGNAFIGSADDLARNLQDFFTVISAGDKEKFTTLYAARVKDWRL